MTKTLIFFPTIRETVKIEVLFSNNHRKIFEGFNESICLCEALEYADRFDIEIYSYATL